MYAPSPTLYVRVAIVACVALSVTPAQAQRQLMAGALGVGEGFQAGSGQGGESIVMRAPIFLDAALRAWTDERPGLIYGASVRLEVDGGPAVAAVPRLEIRRDLGPLVLMPGIGLPFFFAPFSMLGVEASLTARLAITRGFSVLAALLVDAYFFGSDVPADSIIFMMHGLVGGQLEF